MAPLTRSVCEHPVDTTAILNETTNPRVARRITPQGTDTADKQAITELLGKGGRAYDTPDVDFLADMFTTDETFDLSIDGMGQVGSFAGRAEIRKPYEDSLATQETSADTW